MKSGFIKNWGGGTCPVPLRPGAYASTHRIATNNSDYRYQSHSCSLKLGDLFCKALKKSISYGFWN